MITSSSGVLLTVALNGAWGGLGSCWEAAWKLQKRRPRMFGAYSVTANTGERAIRNAVAERIRLGPLSLVGENKAWQLPIYRSLPLRIVFSSFVCFIPQVSLSSGQRSGKEV